MGHLSKSNLLSGGEGGGQAGWPGPSPDSKCLRVGPAIGVLRAIESLGFDPAVVLKSAGVEPDVFSHPDNLIDIVELGCVAVAAQHLTGRDEIGILAARLVEPGALGVVERLVMEGPDLRTSLRNLVRFLHSHDRPALPSLSIVEGEVHLRYEIRDPGFAGANIIHDCSIGIAYRLVQALCGPLWSPTAVLLSRREPRDPEPYHSFFNKRVQFSAAEDAVVFGEEWLDWKAGRPFRPFSQSADRREASAGYRPAEDRDLPRPRGGIRRQSCRPALSFPPHAGPPARGRQYELERASGRSPLFPCPAIACGW